MERAEAKQMPQETQQQEFHKASEASAGVIDATADRDNPCSSPVKLTKHEEVTSGALVKTTEDKIEAKLPTDLASSSDVIVMDPTEFGIDLGDFAFDDEDRPRTAEPSPPR